MHKSLTKPILWLVVLVGLLGALIVFSGISISRNMPTQAQDGTTPTDERGVRIPPERPAPTDADMIVNQLATGAPLAEEDYDFAE